MAISASYTCRRRLDRRFKLVMLKVLVVPISVTSVDGEEEEDDDDGV